MRDLYRLELLTNVSAKDKRSLIRTISEKLDKFNIDNVDCYQYNPCIEIWADSECEIIKEIRNLSLPDKCYLQLFKLLKGFKK